MSNKKSELKVSCIITNLFLHIRKCSCYLIILEILLLTLRTISCLHKILKILAILNQEKKYSFHKQIENLVSVYRAYLHYISWKFNEKIFTIFLTILLLMLQNRILWKRTFSLSENILPVKNNKFLYGWLKVFRNDYSLIFHKFSLWKV